MPNPPFFSTAIKLKCHDCMSSPDINTSLAAWKEFLKNKIKVWMYVFFAMLKKGMGNVFPLLFHDMQTVRREFAKSDLPHWSFNTVACLPAIKKY